MANSRVFLSDLKSGKCSSTINVRLLCFWEARNVRRGGELMWLDMLMAEVNATMMQATIYANRLPTFRSHLTAGLMYLIYGFGVVRCAQSFKLSGSSLMIRFTDSISLVEITDLVSPLPVEGFRFRNQTKLYGLANTETHLPGELTVVKSSVSDPPEEKNHLMTTIILDK